MATVKIVGINRLIAKFKAVADIDMSPIVNKAIAVVEASAISRVPVNDGYLRNSIHPEKARHTGNGEYSGRVFTNKEYAPYVEFGTGAKGNGTYPFSVPGLTLSYRSTPWAFENDKGETIWTNGQVAQPFMYPALKTNETRIKKMMQMEYKKALARKAKGGK